MTFSTTLKSKKSWIVKFLGLSSLLLSLQFSVSASNRHALVIGNADYKIGPLKNPSNDANSISASLERLGFKVTKILNSNRRYMREAVKDFGKSLSSNDVSLFFYAGHAVQVEHTNYLIPLGANIESETDFEYEALPLDYVFDTLKAAKNRQNIVILDACRNNPFKAHSRGLVRGLAQTDGPKGTLIAYATAPGAVALDGIANNGVFTGALLEHIDTEGISLEQVFKRTLAKVNQETRGKQVPWISSSFYQDFYFNGKQALPQAYVAQKSKYVQNSMAQLTMRSNIFQDQVTIDDNKYGSTPLTISLKPGNHTVKIERTGFTTWQQEINLSTGNQIKWAQLAKKVKAVSYKNGDRFIGTLLNKKKDGKGIYIYSNKSKFAGDKFYGEYKNGLKHGFGSYIHGNGEQYTGQYLQGKRTGKGTITFNNGSQYYGDFIAGKQTGSGSIIYSDQSSYSGKFLNGHRHGHGIYYFADGHSFEGSFNHGKRNGKGICTDINGNESECSYLADISVQ